MRLPHKLWRLRRRKAQAHDLADKARARAWAQRVDSGLLEAVLKAGRQGRYAEAARVELERRRGR